MAKLTRAQFLVKYNGLFADNEIQNITEATFREWALDMLDSFAGQDKGPNDTIGGVKLVMYLTRAEALRAGRYENATLDGIDPLTVIIGNLARVDITATGRLWLEAVWDDGQGPYPFGPGFLGLLDGSAKPQKGQLPDSAGLIGIKWVLKDSPETALANVPLYQAGRDFRQNDLVRQLFGTFPNQTTVVFYCNESGDDIPAPSRPEGDAYWSVFNPAPPVTYPFQTVTPAELRQLRATAKLATNRLYVVSPRPILDDEEDRANPDVYVRALMETELEATAWLLIGPNNKQLVTYDLATDTTSPVASGASSFAQLQGSARNNSSLASELAVVDTHTYQIAQLLNAHDARIVVKDPAGAITVWTSLPTSIPNGSLVTVYGNVSFPRLDYQVPTASTWCLAPGAVLTLYNLRPPNTLAPFVLCGPGTLNSQLNPGPRATSVLIQDITLNGHIYAYAFAYNNTIGPLRSLKMRNVRQTSTTPDYAAITLDYGLDTGYRTYIQAEITNCLLTSATDGVCLFNGSAAFQDADALANNRLLLSNNVLSVGAGKQVIKVVNDQFQVTLGGNKYLPGTAPAAFTGAVLLAGDEPVASGGSGGGGGGGSSGGGDTSTTYFLRVASTTPSGAGNVSDTGPNYLDGDGFYKLKKATNLANIEITKSGGSVVFTGAPGTWPAAGVFLNESSTATYTIRLTPSNVALNVELVASAVVA